VVSVVATIRERRLQHALLAALGAGRVGAGRAAVPGAAMLSVAGRGASSGRWLLLVPAVTLTPGGAAPSRRCAW
jgi:hypothetical protein